MTVVVVVVVVMALAVTITVADELVDDAVEAVLVLAVVGASVVLAAGPVVDRATHSP